MRFSGRGDARFLRVHKRAIGIKKGACVDLSGCLFFRTRLRDRTDGSGFVLVLKPARFGSKREGLKGNRRTSRGFPRRESRGRGGAPTEGPDRTIGARGPGSNGRGAISGSGVPGSGPPNGGKDADVAGPGTVRRCSRKGAGQSMWLQKRMTKARSVSRDRIYWLCVPVPGFEAGVSSESLMMCPRERRSCRRSSS